ncbi:MAG TPA: bifunctional transaldolase/phosoglucose isomerase [Blastocatellia bacterium]|jgi:glucose-6-phosphate isomerase|nr:bifunctional transaldolase/phosoglucose isomerase [Blastocatellia bacterium]
MNYDSEIKEALDRISREGVVRRIWDRDASLWKIEPEHQKVVSNSLGWLTVPRRMNEEAEEIRAFADGVRKEGFAHVVVLGMGGSSLCPEVFRRTFGHTPGFPELLVLDSTVPAAVLDLERKIDPAKTLFIVSSKSGTTTEPQVFFEYFFDKAGKALEGDAGPNFIAITDPGTLLARQAEENRFRRVFLNPPDIGGRYSALSYFGIVPAALAGYDIRELLDSALRAVKSCEVEGENPGAQLGAALGTLARKGRDKLTLVIPPPLDSLGLWIEQLIAESTGKEGVGILPVSGEPLADPPAYGNDRVFAYIQTQDSPDPETEAGLARLVSEGHPVIVRTLNNKYELGEEFFMWEFATAVAGSILGINPFDQPNVQESKDNTKALLEEFEREGRLAEQELLAEEGGLRIYADAAMKTLLATPVLEGESGPSLASVISLHLASVRLGDYVALTAYIEETPEHDLLLREIRLAIRDNLRVATTVGYGPRFLHSTGQFHKGGPPSGVFIQITSDDPEDVPIPGRPYGFSVLKRAQALGDFQSLASRNLRAIRFHAGDQVAFGLSALGDLVKRGAAGRGRD